MGLEIIIDDPTKTSIFYPVLFLDSFKIYKIYYKLKRGDNTNKL